MELQIDFTPSIAKMRGGFRALDSAMRRPREPLRDSVEQVVIPSLVRGFETGGYGEWAPLKASTIERKERQGVANPAAILVQSGRLEKAVSYRARWSFLSDVARMDNLPQGAAYGYFHASGTEFMPAREFALYQDQDVRAIEGVFTNWLRQAIKRSLP